MCDYIECVVCDEPITSQEECEASDSGNVHTLCLNEIVMEAID